MFQLEDGVAHEIYSGVTFHELCRWVDAIDLPVVLRVAFSIVTVARDFISVRNWRLDLV